MTDVNHAQAIVIGAGPAGLMAAETLAAAGVETHIFDSMPTPARKFLMAGKSGLNLTHSEPKADFVKRYGDAEAQVARTLEAFDGEAVRAWAESLGSETFIGSSGRVFPKAFKASPLLRAWLGRLRDLGATLHVRHSWKGWDAFGDLVFETPEGRKVWRADATILALGGGSWPRLGSDGAWARILEARGITPVPFRAANCGFDCAWSDHFRDRFEGEPVKNVTLYAEPAHSRGDFVITKDGIEGSAIYAVSATVRDRLDREGHAGLIVDLMPDRDEAALAKAIARPRGKQSMATHLKKTIGLKGVRAGLVRELSPESFGSPTDLAHAIKHLRLPVLRPRPLEEAISTAGGIAFSDLDDRLMIRSLPGVFAAGEMLDWEAPTGGYLITACMAEGKQAANGALEWLKDLSKMQ